MLQPVELMHRLESLIGTATIGHTIADLKVKLTQNSEACSTLLEEVDRCIADVAKSGTLLGMLWENKAMMPCRSFWHATGLVLLAKTIALHHDLT